MMYVYTFQNIQWTSKQDCHKHAQHDNSLRILVTFHSLYVSLSGKLSHASCMLLQAEVPNPPRSCDHLDDDHMTYSTRQSSNNFQAVMTIVT